MFPLLSWLDSKYSAKENLAWDQLIVPIETDLKYVGESN